MRFVLPLLASSAFVASCAGTRSAPAARVLELGWDDAPLQAWFEDAREHPRAILLLSPM